MLSSAIQKKSPAALRTFLSSLSEASQSELYSSLLRDQDLAAAPRFVVDESNTCKSSLALARAIVPGQGLDRTKSPSVVVMSPVMVAATGAAEVVAAPAVATAKGSSVKEGVFFSCHVCEKKFKRKWNCE